MSCHTVSQAEPDCRFFALCRLYAEERYTLSHAQCRTHNYIRNATHKSPTDSDNSSCWVRMMCAVYDVDCCSSQPNGLWQTGISHTYFRWCQALSRRHITLCCILWHRSPSNAIINRTAAFMKSSSSSSSQHKMQCCFVWSGKENTLLRTVHKNSGKIKGNDCI